MFPKKTIILLLTALVFVGCASTNPIEAPKTKEELDLWIQAEQFVRQEETKAKTLWMYSTGSFALLCLGLAVLAFAPARRASGLFFVVGGLIGMASVWVFDSKWFPWVAGITLGIIILNALAFMWVKMHGKIFSS